MTQSIAVVVNRGGGAASRAGDALGEQVEAAFSAAGLTPDLHLVDGGALAPTITKLARTGAVAVGGGDGTQGTAAAILAEAGATHGILPLGTRNNLARTLGLPLDLEGAARVIADGHVKAIDLSAANGHVFVNNASIGLYPQLVEARESERARSGMPKWVANIPASWTVLRGLRHHRFRIKLDDAEQPIVTPLLFVGNNVYLLEAGKVGTRDALDDGKLSVFAVARNSRLGMIGFAMRTLVGRSDADSDFAAIGTCACLTVASHRRRIKIALDGEVFSLNCPVEIRVRPGALNVFVPRSSLPTEA